MTFFYVEIMKIKSTTYTLELKHTFSISYYSRNTTPSFLIQIDDGSITGFGEASLPQYLSENIETVTKFLSNVELRDINNNEELFTYLAELDNASEGNTAAKAAIDIALHDYLGKKLEIPCYKIYDIDVLKLPLTSITIGIDTEDTIRKKILEADQFKILKIKLGTEKDKEVIRIVREVTDKPLYVDINQGWKDKHYAFDMICWLHSQNVLLVEQPMPVNNYDDSGWLKEKSPIPIIADEAVKRYNDVDFIKDFYDGINIKLMKCSGIYEAYRMIQKARSCKLKVMLGCMTETSCAISAAIHLSSLADYADLDGNQLIVNDPFDFQSVINGRLCLNNLPGLGIRLKKDLF